MSLQNFLLLISLALLFGLSLFSFYAFEKKNESEKQTEEGVENQISVGQEVTLLQQLDLATGTARANLKVAEIAKIGAKARTSRNGHDIEIVEMGAFDGGIGVFIRAWVNNEQIGFGADGTVDIERVRIHNPPILVPDPTGTVIRYSYLDPFGEDKGTTTRRYRIDFTEALYQVLEDVVSDKQEKSVSGNIVAGKRGNTTSVFRPVAGANSPMDAYYQTQTTDSFANHRADTVADAASATLTDGDAVIRFLGSTNIDRFGRSATLFDISSISTGDTISSSSIALYGGLLLNDLDQSAELGLVSFSAPSGDDTAATSDYNITNFGSTEYSPRYPATDWTTTNYNTTTLNATGISFLQTAQAGDGIVRFGHRSGWDIDNSAPTCTGCTGNTFGLMRWLSADTTDTTQDPYLIVEHTAAAANSPTLDLYGDIEFQGDLRLQ